MNLDPAGLAEKILRDLNDLWLSLSRQDKPDDQGGVLRACSLTMIVVCDYDDDPVAVGETLSALMRGHPSRAIVVRVRASGDDPIDARVFAQCWMPGGSRQQICCEQIEIVVPLKTLEDAGLLLQSLVAPDLPVVVWCRAEEIAALPAFRELVPQGGKLILDSKGGPDASRSLATLAGFAEGGIRVADLNWTRLTRWRKAIAQIFEQPQQRSRLPEVTTLSIAHRDGSRPVTAYYLAAWIEQVLGRRLKLDFSTLPDAEEGFIQRVSLKGEKLRCSVSRKTGDQVHLEVNELIVPARFPFLADHELLHEELAILRKDTVYDEVLRAAMRLAGEDRRGS